MYLLIFRYCAVLCLIISFCYSCSSPVGYYHKLVLVQQLATASFFPPLLNSEISTDELLEYINQHLTIFEADRWIVQAVWPVSDWGEILEYCEDTSGAKPTYHPNSLNQDFKNYLKTRWPSVRTNETDEDVWKREFDRYGSCFSYTPFDYFSSTLTLLDGPYNVGRILSTYNIVPGGRYELEYIAESLKNLKKRFNLKCLQSQNAQEQYLYQVQLCFDHLNSRKLVNCRPSGIDGCYGNKTVIYPGSSREQ